jgi:hypothetical protein
MRFLTQFWRSLGFSLWVMVLAGCGSDKSGAGNPSPDHYVAVPPQTGSMIHRRVKVDDSGKPIDPSEAGAVRSIDPASLERLRPVSNPGGTGH